MVGGLGKLTVLPHAPLLGEGRGGGGGGGGGGKREAYRITVCAYRPEILDPGSAPGTRHNQPHEAHLRSRVGGYVVGSCPVLLVCFIYMGRRKASCI